MTSYVHAKIFDPEDGGSMTFRNVGNAAHFRMTQRFRNKVNTDTEQVISYPLKLVIRTNVSLMGDMYKASDLFPSL
jgi:hypothetical protein